MSTPAKKTKTEPASKELPVEVTAPKNLNLFSVELTGDLVILRGQRWVFSELKDFTMVFKRIK